MQELEDKLVTLELQAAGLAELAPNIDGSCLVKYIDVLRMAIADAMRTFSDCHKGG